MDPIIIICAILFVGFVLCYQLSKILSVLESIEKKLPQETKETKETKENDSSV